MKKLKLESLEITSFATTTAGAGERGTVAANADIKPGGPVTLQTYDIVACGDTQYFDCTLGCSHLTNCGDCFTRPLSADCGFETVDCPIQ